MESLGTLEAGASVTMLLVLGLTVGQAGPAGCVCMSSLELNDSYGERD